uniref:uncharacterized protein LOC122609874 n=1 Tax=Erigeron canadensis TaxID=72917 RepID=UPI001CB9324E|nr:uncharacterized protein LOC122609874 [Erigeron canadensis]
MATPTAAETTVIGIDTGFFLYGSHPFVKAQMEAIKHYADVKLQCNPKNRVGIYRMTEGYDGFELSPTNNLKEILLCVEGLASHCGGVVDFQDAVKDILAFPGWRSSNMKKRLLVFVGTSINLRMEDVRLVGLMLKEKDIILNVVNFFVLEQDMLRLYNRVPREKFQYKREELLFATSCPRLY